MSARMALGEQTHETSNGSEFSGPTLVLGLATSERLTAHDPAMSQRVVTLERRTTWSKVLIFAGPLVGAALVVASLTVFKETGNSDYGDVGAMTSGPKVPLALSGIAIGLVAPLMGWAVWPKHADVEETVGEWNAKHPAQPLRWAP